MGDRNSDRHRPPALVDGLRILFALVRVMLVSTLKSVFATSSSGTLHRSALFLVLFLVVHMAGNLSVFFGQSAFNMYGHALSGNPLIKFIEAYLALGFLAHIVTASWFTYKKAKFIKKSPRANGQLAATGTVLLVFIVMHLRHFRFGEERPWTEPGSGTKMRDLYGLQRDLFSDPLQVTFYLASIGAVGWHLWIGWTKTVLKMDIEQEMRAPFEKLGKALIVPLCGGFSAVVLFSYYIAHSGAAAGAAGGEL
jgi:succinate dehydrogenase / fumarate reductase cytochrome b subunit